MWTLVRRVELLNHSVQLEECKQDSARLAVVEANWEFLKSELAVAKAASSKADKKVSPQLLPPSRYNGIVRKRPEKRASRGVD